MSYDVAAANEWNVCVHNAIENELRMMLFDKSLSGLLVLCTKDGMD